MEKHSITDLLRAWPHEPGRINARTIETGDGRRLLQVRLELGILELESSGRPDGRRPHGAESLFELLSSGTSTHDGDAMLDAVVCRELREEAALYSYRSVVFSVLDDLEGVLRDTERNLHAAEFIIARARNLEDRSMAREALPHLLMMRARARSTISVRRGDLKLARLCLDEGLVELERVHRDRGGREAFEESQEARILLGMREMLVPQLPASQRHQN